MANEERIIGNHASVAIITDPNREVFLFSQYDDEYPKEMYRKAINLMGGNYEHGIDKSPLDILNREIDEELGSRVAGRILSTVNPLGDYFIDAITHKSIVSLFEAETDLELLRDLDRRIMSGERVISEGLAKVLTIDEITSGKYNFAHMTPQLLGEYLGGVFLGESPYHVEKIGVPRAVMRDYLGDKDFSWHADRQLDRV